jgi:hypothetical protein
MPGHAIVPIATDLTTGIEERAKQSKSRGQKIVAFAATA